LEIILDSNLEINIKLLNILPRVQKPGRYVGGEYNQVIKEWEKFKTRVALIFPDVYEIGLPNLGLAILYETINDRKDSLAERSYSPWLDMEEQMRENNIPAYSLESKHPLIDFDIIGISLPYETLYTNVLNILDLAHIPLLSKERKASDPLIIAGGNSTFNPEPMYQFIDAFVIGDGEGIIHEIIDIYQNWKESKQSRISLLELLAGIEGIYVPHFYDVTYEENNCISIFSSNNSHAPLPIKRHMVATLPPSPVKFLVPNIITTHNRIAVEIMRGCTQGCRFCQAGMINRPIRERSVDEIIKSLQESLLNTGFEEISLLSLSSSDYTQLNQLIDSISKEFCEKNITISLPSLRIDTFSVKLMDSLVGKRHGSFTFAPESATNQLRNRINKPISTENLHSVAREVFRHKWSTIKLYFMIGFPNETINDIDAICTLSKEVLAIGKSEMGNRASLNISINTFIPKPHTPFQWATQENQDSISEKQKYLRNNLHERGIKLNWSDNDSSLLEACLSRGDRRLANVIYDAWKSGAKFDAWYDQFNFKIWQEAFINNHVEPSFYASRQRNLAEILPWDHINIGITKKALIEEYQLSKQDIIRKDCREQCYSCGIQQNYLIKCMTKNNPATK
jgi:radical SAM family uncharacterized protein